MNIKLMPDYGCSPLWWDNEPGRIGNIDPLELGLPADLRDDLYAWAERFDATLNQEDPAASQFTSKAELDTFILDGELLSQRVREALGQDWRVRYLPPPA